MLKVITLFTGIGAQEAALKRLGLDFEIVGISEIDKYAIQSYEAINGSVRNYGDITQIERLDYADLWTYSFPCQDLSFAGKQRGISEETRSGLLLHVERLLTESVLYGTQPKYLLLENVKALVSKKFMPDFQRWLDKLEQLGYNNYWQILNAKDYGIPQNRERVFVVSIRKDVDTKGYKFPSPVPLEKRLKDMLEPCVDEKYYLSADKVEKLTSQIKEKEVSNTIRCGGGSLDGKHTWDIIATPVNLDKDGNARAICNNYSKQGVDNIPMLSNGYCIRKLTPRECWRLMGFTDIEFECAKLSGVSNSQLYKQAGNSIVVNVLVGIFKGLFDDRF
jgi:DNA (cytosine-5)-methyltransferase 1